MGPARGDLKFTPFEGRMTSQRFVEFLRKLRADTGKPIIVIADNAKYHKDGPKRPTLTFYGRPDWPLPPDLEQQTA